MPKTVSKDELLKSCGNAIRAMRHVRQTLQDLGLVADAEILRNAEKELSFSSLYFFEDTPISGILPLKKP